MVKRRRLVVIFLVLALVAIFAAIIIVGARRAAGEHVNKVMGDFLGSKNAFKLERANITMLGIDPRYHFRGTVSKEGMEVIRSTELWDRSLGEFENYVLLITEGSRPGWWTEHDNTWTRMLVEQGSRSMILYWRTGSDEIEGIIIES